MNVGDDEYLNIGYGILCQEIKIKDTVIFLSSVATNIILQSLIGCGWLPIKLSETG